MPYTYLIQSDSVTKIGKSDHPRKRLASLQTGNPSELILRSVCKHANENEALEYERELHHRYIAKHVTLEWFDLSSTDLADIEADHNWTTPKPKPPRPEPANTPGVYSKLAVDRRTAANIETTPVQLNPEWEKVVHTHSRESTTKKPYQLIKWQNNKWLNRSPCETLDSALGYAAASNRKYGSGNPVGATFVLNTHTNELWVAPLSGQIVRNTLT